MRHLARPFTCKHSLMLGGALRREEGDGGKEQAQYVICNTYLISATKGPGLQLCE